MPRIELYAFEFFDPIRERWVRARYVATREEIAARHPQYRIVGKPEVREVGDPVRLTAGHLARAPSGKNGP